MINDNNNPSIKVYVNKIENIITLLIKTIYLELIIPETIKLFGNTENKITKEENGENACPLQITNY